MKKEEIEKQGVIKKIYHLLQKKQKMGFIVIIAIMVISAVLSQLLPLAIGTLTDDVLNQENLSFQGVIPFLLVILAITITNEVIKVIRRLIVEDTCTRTEKNARVQAIQALLMAPLSYFRENMTGNIHGKLNRSLEGTIKLLKLLFMDFAPAIFTGLAAIVVIFSKLPFILAVIMLLVVPIGIFIVLRQVSTQKGIRVELLEKKSGMDGTMVELINGIEVIRICDSVKYECNRFNEKSEYLRKKEMKHHRAMAMYDCLKFINEAVFTVVVIGVSAYLAAEGVISVGTVLTAYLCFTQLTNPLRELHRIFDELSESTVLAKEFFKIIEIPNDFSYQSLPEGKENRKESEQSFIQIENLDFYYNEDKNKKILQNFNLQIEKGQFLGIAGPSGCGKSSLIKAITKLEKAEGKIKIEGRTIESYTRKELAEEMALVPQVPFLIAGTIYENICYGIEREVSIEEVKLAAKRAYIDTYIESLPGQYEFIIAEAGGNLSGGQRQRIAIARIFLRKPKILILDEATSALDNTSEKHIQNEIEKLQKENGTTILSIAHRLTTLKNCDRIIVLQNGNMVQDGKYEELIEEPGIFSDMYHGKLK